MHHVRFSISVTSVEAVIAVQLRRLFHSTRRPGSFQAGPDERDVGFAVKNPACQKPNLAEKKKGLCFLRTAALVYEVELTAGFTLRFIPDAPGSNIHSDLLQDDHLVSANVGP
jgi:hypothetical protein